MQIRFLLPIQTALLILLLLAGISLHATAAPPEKKITLAYSASMFSDVNLKDAKLAMEIWSKKLAARMGFDYKTDFQFYKDFSALLAAVRAGKVNFVQLPPFEYIGIREREMLEPLLVGVKNASPYETFVLVVHRGSSIKRMADLRNRRIIIEKGRKGTLPLIWLDTVLMEEKFPLPGKFFQRVIEEDTPSRSILPVYFHQADACLVTKEAYETSVELNPGVGKSLAVLKESPGFVSGFLCAHRKTEPDKKKAILESARKLENEPEGKQILTLFRMDRVEVYKPEYLKSTEELLARHKELLKKR